MEQKLKFYMFILFISWEINFLKNHFINHSGINFLVNPFLGRR